MNYFYELPEVLQDKILDIRDNNMANMIQKLWFRYNSRFAALIDLSNNCYYYDEHYSSILEISCKKTAEIIEYIAKKLTVENQNNSCYFSNKWYKLLNDISEGLEEEEYIGGPGAVYYDRVENAYNRIIIKIMYRKRDNISKIKGFTRITWEARWSRRAFHGDHMVIYCPLLCI